MYNHPHPLFLHCIRTCHRERASGENTTAKNEASRIDAKRWLSIFDKQGRLDGLRLGDFNREHLHYIQIRRGMACDACTVRSKEDRQGLQNDGNLNSIFFLHGILHRWRWRYGRIIVSGKASRLPRQ